MKKENRKSKHWPMNWILGGVFLLAFVVLLAHGLQSEDTGPRVHRSPDRVLPEAVVQASPSSPPSPIAPTEQEELVAADAPALSPEREPEPLPARFDEAEARFHAAEYIQAASRFARYCEEHPDNPWGHYMLGLSEWKLGNLEAAEASLSRGLDLDSSFVKARRNLARVLMAGERHQEALDLLAVADEGELVEAEGQRLIGRALHNLGRIDQAVDAYAAALAADPVDAWSLNNLGLIYVEGGREDDALAAFALASDLDDDNAVFRNNLGVALERCGHPAQAAEAYRCALDLDEEHERARLSLTRVEAVAGALDSEIDLATLTAHTADELAAGRFPWTREPDVEITEQPDSEPTSEPLTEETHLSQLP